MLSFYIVDFEASFLRLLEKVTNGATIEISYTGMPHCCSAIGTNEPGTRSG